MTGYVLNRLISVNAYKIQILSLKGISAVFLLDRLAAKYLLRLPAKRNQPSIWMKD